MSDTLPPGRELDTLVAEKVMGWRSWDARFKPSADWDAMRLVVERLVALGWYVEMTAGSANGDVTLYFDTTRGIRGPIDAIGDTLPHAVALAALKAVEASRE